MRKLYYVYILTNRERTVLYTGMTNDIVQRLSEHYLNKGKEGTFAGKYYCYHLIYYEEHLYVADAIRRETEIKGWRREKKVHLIESTNPDWTFLNGQLCGNWPPDPNATRF